MQLLVSVADKDDATAALAGGADIIDAKDPHAGALGAVSLDAFRRIHAAVDRARPVSAALGDAHDELTIARLAHDYAKAGAAFVKVGFEVFDARSRLSRAQSRDVRSLIAAAVRGASPTSVIAVTYADRTTSPARDRLIDLASSAGAAGVLIDTADKTGPSLPSLIDTRELTRWIARAHDARVTVAVAGKLSPDDLMWVRECGADIAGVRGAACVNGRASRVVAEKVRLLRAAIAPLAAPA
jgi:uncharacterized protein (UPF0264 family)